MASVSISALSALTDSVARFDDSATDLVEMPLPLFEPSFSIEFTRTMEAQWLARRMNLCDMLRILKHIPEGSGRGADLTTMNAHAIGHAVRRALDVAPNVTSSQWSVEKTLSSYKTVCLFISHKSSGKRFVAKVPLDASVGDAHVGPLLDGLSLQGVVPVVALVKISVGTKTIAVTVTPHVQGLSADDVAEVVVSLLREHRRAFDARHKASISRVTSKLLAEMGLKMLTSLYDVARLIKKLSSNIGARYRGRDPKQEQILTVWKMRNYFSGPAACVADEACIEFALFQALDYVLAQVVPQVIDILRRIREKLPGFRHNDLSASNLMIDMGDDRKVRARIIDFGLSQYKGIPYEPLEPHMLREYGLSSQVISVFPDVFYLISSIAHTSRATDSLTAMSASGYVLHPKFWGFSKNANRCLVHGNLRMTLTAQQALSRYDDVLCDRVTRLCETMSVEIRQLFQKASAIQV